MLMRCYIDGGMDYDLEALGVDAWLTGCPLCGGTCWSDISREQRDEIDKELDEENK